MEKALSEILLSAVRDGNIFLVQTLLENSADPNYRDEHDLATPVISIAVVENRSEIVHLLIEAGADVNAQDKLGRTALTYACALNRRKLVSFLLASGACSNTLDRQGYKPRRVAIHRGHKKIVKLLS
jgi:uncharacterized protein